MRETNVGWKVEKLKKLKKLKNISQYTEHSKPKELRNENGGVEPHEGRLEVVKLLL